MSVEEHRVQITLDIIGRLIAPSGPPSTQKIGRWIKALSVGEMFEQRVRLLPWEVALVIGFAWLRLNTPIGPQEAKLVALHARLRLRQGLDTALVLRVGRTLSVAAEEPKKFNPSTNLTTLLSKPQCTALNLSMVAQSVELAARRLAGRPADEQFIDEVLS